MRAGRPEGLHYFSWSATLVTPAFAHASEDSLRARRARERAVTEEAFERHEGMK